jgi:hypothetical protein
VADQQRLPEGLADMPPGPALAAVLARVDPTRLNGHDLVALAPAYLRMLSHYQAGLATVLNEAERCPPGDASSPPTRTEPHGWSHLELAAKLHWTAGKATYELRHAYHLTQRLPDVHAALAAGVIDTPRARLFVDGLTCVDEQPAREIAGRLLAAGAGRWNTKQLSARLRRAVITHDPDAAARKQRERLAERWVQAEPHPEGTANLVGVNLPPERVAEIMERLAAIARTAKRQGDPRTLHQLKADSYLDLLAGTGIGATPPGPITNPDRTFTPRTATDDTRQRRQPATPGPGDRAGQQRDSAEATAAPVQASQKPPAEPPAPPRAEVDVPLPGPRRGVVELTAPLSSLIGWSQAPGTLAGWGPVITDICRQIVAQDPTARWRFSIYDDLLSDGQLAYHGITHARPTPTTGRNGFSATDTAFLRTRDRTCRGPHGCHHPASQCDLDHTVAKVDGGGHERANGGALCKREHRYKHESGAELRQPEPGIFEWTTPLGHRYTIKPEPYDESTGPPKPPDP